MRQKVGLLTIGQSPRVDMTPEMATFLEEHVDFVEMGAVDDLTDEELKALDPGLDDVTYISRLRDGRSIKLAKQALLPKLQEKITLLEEAGVSSTILVCTGKFPAFSHSKPLLFPDKVLSATVQAVLQNGKLGVIIPLAEQEPFMKEKWEGFGFEVEYRVASPYDEADFATPATELKEAGANLIVLDCMGYTVEQKFIVSRISGLPVILARSIVARIASELVLT